MLGGGDGERRARVPRSSYNGVPDEFLMPRPTPGLSLDQERTGQEKQTWGASDRNKQSRPKQNQERRGSTTTL